MSDHLSRYGWSHWRAAQFDGFCQFSGQAAEPGRVIAVERNTVTLATAGGERVVAAERNLDDDTWPPVVGDWVGLGETGIAFVLPRQSYLERPSSARGAQSQPVAANVAVVLIVEPLPNFSAGRIERITALARHSGIEAWVVASKADLVTDDVTSSMVSSIEGIVDRVFITRLDDPTSFSPLHVSLADAGTAVLFGRSGAGKSTLVNQLLGTDLATAQVRQSDGKGRHTTTRRTLITDGAIILIDSPGIREVAAPEDRDAIDAVFSAIQALAENCWFTDCTHKKEPRCAVQRAIKDGTLDATHLERYQRMLREAKRNDPRQAREQRSEERRQSKNATRGRRYAMAQKNRQN